MKKNTLPITELEVGKTTSDEGTNYEDNHEDEENSVRVSYVNNDGEGFFFLNRILVNELDVGLHAVKNHNQDLVIIFDGQEGSGKSQSARQIAVYCSKVLGSFFDLDGVSNIHNDLDTYVDSDVLAPKFCVRILDESRKILNKKRSTSADAVRFTNYLSECRSLNHVHILLLPSFHDLDRYVAQWRMSFVIHMQKKWFIDPSVVLGGHRLELGFFCGYVNSKKLRFCYDDKGFNYPRKPDFSGRFDNVEVLSKKGMHLYEEQKKLKMSDKYANVDFDYENNTLAAKFHSGNRSFVALTNDEVVFREKRMRNNKK